MTPREENLQASLKKQLMVCSTIFWKRKHEEKLGKFFSSCDPFRQGSSIVIGTRRQF